MDDRRKSSAAWKEDGFVKSNQRRNLKEEKRVLKITAFVFIITILTKALQIVFFPLVATFFGTSRELESFIVAYSIPAFISTVLFGNFGTAFILIFTKQRLKHGEESAWEFASSMINIVFLGAIAISAAGVWLSRWIIVSPRGLGEKPSPLGEDFSMLAVWNIIVNPAIPFMT
jgi:peptidoglycan biosynthesis protein MviN/MurJ (putative lipid II flippase)